MRRIIYFAMICMVVFGVMSFETKVAAQQTQEYTAHISDPEFKDVIEESMGDIIESRASSRSFSTTVKPGQRHTTGYFSVSKGKYVTIVATLSSSAKIGLIDADGHVRYVTGTNINHAFLITQTNAYCVFIQNVGSNTVTAKGTYAWN